MNMPHKVFFVDSFGKLRYDVLGSRKLAMQHAEAYAKAGYTDIVVFDVYNNVEIEIK